MKNKGFTLIELMIVVAIIGILGAIAIPNFIKFQCRSHAHEMRMDESVCDQENGPTYVGDIYNHKRPSVYPEKPAEQQAPHTQEGTIECYLPNGQSYHTGKFTGEVHSENNTFTYTQLSNGNEIKVSGPCIVKQTN